MKGDRALTTNSQLSTLNSQIPKGYKQTEVGVIPKDWTLSNLGNLGKLKNGINKGSEAFGHGFPFVNLMDVFGVSHIFSISSLSLVDTNSTEQQVYDLKEGDVLFVRSSVKPSGVGLTVVIEADLPKTVYSGFLIRFRDGNTIAQQLKRYCFYEEGFRKRLVSASSVSANTNINQDNLKQLLIALPSTIAEQNLIARTLSDTDALIESLEQLLAKKRQIKQGAMQKLLTGKRRIPGFGEREGYKQTEFGVIPSDWNFQSVGDLVKDFRGGAPLKPSDFIESGFKVLPKGGVGKEGILKIDEKNQQFCSHEYADSHANNRVDLDYTIVVLRDLVPSGPSIGLVVKIVNSEQYILAQGVYGFKVDTEKLIPEWLIHLSNTHFYRKLMNSIMVGSTQVHITNTAFKEAKIPLPSGIAEQTAIATILSDMDLGIGAIETKLTKARQLKQGMMHELLTGRVRLIERAPS